jgi:hypothetical protein
MKETGLNAIPPIPLNHCLSWHQTTAPPKVAIPIMIGTWLVT